MTLFSKMSYLFSKLSIIVFIFGVILINESLGHVDNDIYQSISHSRKNVSLRYKRSEFQGRNYYLNPIYGAQLNGGFGEQLESFGNGYEEQPYTNKPKRNKKKHDRVAGNGKLETKIEEEDIPDQLAVEAVIKEDKKEPKDESRACTACVSGDCSPNTVISGLPGVQILAAIFAGAVLAALFIFLYKNFIDSEPQSSGGYGYAAATPQSSYGAPQMQYGAPQMQYGAPMTKYGTPSRNGYGRSFGSFDFNQLSNFVWKAIEKFGDFPAKSPTGN